MEIEHLTDWIGQEVVGSDGEKIGKLEDVYFRHGTNDADIACVKAGLLGRKLYAVPLAGGAIARDHLSVAFTKDAVTGGPQLDGGQLLGTPELSALDDHYGAGSVPGAGDSKYESAHERDAQATRSSELADEIRDLDKEAAKKREGEREGQHKADVNADAAETLETRKANAEAEVRKLGGDRD